MQENALAPRRGRPALRFVALGLALVVAVAVVAVIALRDTAALALLQSVTHGLGYDAGVGSLDVNLGRVVIHDLRIRNAAGEPVLEARDVRVAYSLRDVLPGGKRLFGLESVDLTSPHITVIHHRNGSYNITLPPSSSTAPQPSPPPLNVKLHVTDGSIVLIDRFIRAPAERRERISAIHADGNISPASGASYHAGAELDDGSGRYPIAGSARFDDPRGFELQHWTAADVPIAGLANFALNSHALVFEAGRLRDVDVKVGALSTPAGTMQTHLSATASLAGGTIAAAALTQPLHDAHGRFVIDDDAVTVRALDAVAGGLALHVSGELYHFAAPQIAFALTARGDLARARALSKDSAKLPVTGALAVQGLAEGAASDPLIFARVGAPHIGYGAYRFDGSRGFVAVSGKELDVIEAGSRYGPAVVGLRAALLLAAHTDTTAYATVALPTSGVPYAANLLPGVALRGVAAVHGRDARLAGRGYLGGSNGPNRLDAPFSLDVNGSGTVGPIVLQRGDGASLYARATIDGRRRQTVALADIHALSLLPAAANGLPGFPAPALPPHVDAKLDATLTALAAGTTLTSASGTLHGYGSWGDVRADANAAGGGFAARGRLRSTFEQLAAFTGKVGARGPIDIPFALTNNGSSTIVQVQDARFPGATIRGIALQGADATVGLGGRAVDVYAADLRVAGRAIAASGRFGDGGHVHISAGDIDLAAAPGAGVPLAGGRATVIADVGGTYAKPTADLRAVVAGARYNGTDVGGDVGLTYDGAALRVAEATLAFGGAYAVAGGVVAGLAPKHIAPRYDILAQLDDADIASLARTVKNPLPYPAGTLSAQLHVGGAGAAPDVSGVLQIPEGSINGLYFRDARVGISANRASVAANGGQVTVGSTSVHFSGSATRTEQRANLRAPHIELADFDDYFDDADVLAGSGGLALAVDAAPNVLQATADVGLRNTRYRRFELGRIDGSARTRGRRVNLRGVIDGLNGRVAVAGSVDVPATDPLRDIARRAYVDLNTQLAGIDLGNVLPAAGLDVPVLGLVDATVVVRGRYPALALTARAALTKGVAGRVPIEQFTIAANAIDGRGRITDATLIVPNLNAGLSGTFGLRPEDGFDLRARASSSDINALITTATGKNPGVRGTLATTAQLSGTLARPHVAAALDVHDVTYRGVTVPNVHTDIAATRAVLEVRNGLVALRDGSIAFDGTVPLGGRAVASTPIAFDVVPRNVDVAPYSALLPDGTAISGIFDGNLGVRGTPSVPQLSGSLNFNNGSYRSKLLTSGLTELRLTLDFAGTSVRIAALHARAAPGNIDGTGTLAVRDLRDPVRGSRANINLVLANARIAAPQYYTGFIDGTLSAVKQAGAPLLVGGGLTFSSARIPYTALLPSGGSGTAAAPVLPDVAFDLGVTVGKDVRVKSGPVDIGTAGTARLGGTLAKPTLNGQFSASDGTVSLYRTFNVQNGSTVSFDPTDGITPTVDATAVTNIPDPPTDVLLHITGPSTHLNLDFSSQPPYSKEQILGLLVNAQALGAVSGVASTGGSGSNNVSLSGIGNGLVASQFTSRFLSPFSNSLGGALGLSSLDLNYNPNGAFGAQARRTIGKNVTFISGASFGGTTPQTSFGIRVGNNVTSAQLTIYQATGNQQAPGGQVLTPFLQSNFLSANSSSTPNYALQAITPPTGSGFVFSYQKHFW